MGFEDFEDFEGFEGFTGFTGFTGQTVFIVNLLALNPSLLLGRRKPAAIAQLRSHLIYRAVSCEKIIF